jgi:error-prone DNA polymerase
MQPAGDNVLARWREAGEWWAGESPREIVRFLDEHGIRREKVATLPLLSSTSLTPDELQEKLAPDTNHKEEWSLRIHKRRDEKVAKACGYAPEEPSFAVHTAPVGQAYVPIQTLSGYSFGKSTMLAEEIPIYCANIGLPGAAIADFMSLCGAVEFVKRCQAVGIKPLVGATLDMECGHRLVLIAKSKVGYEQLSQLISACHLEEPRQFPLCRWKGLERYSRDLICLTGGAEGPLDAALIQGHEDMAASVLQRLIGIYGSSNVFIQIERSFLPWQISVERRLIQLAEAFGVTAVAGGSVTHARPDHFPVQDILLCAESLCMVEEILGRKPRRHPSQPSMKPKPERALNGERYLRTPAELAELFIDQPQLLRNTLWLMDRVDDDVLPSRTRLPEIYPDPGHALREITYAGAYARHGKLSQRLRRQIDHELGRIIRLNFADHFLCIHDACRWAEGQNILFSGRGSVVDSAIAYCLGLSRIDAFKHNLHFDRFLPEDGSKRPDIDIDFEAHRREDVRTYLTQRYGVDRVATVAAIGTYMSRGIIREVGKAMGLPNDVIGYLAKRIHGGVTPEKLESALIHRPELAGANVPKERFRWVFELAERMTDLPRNMRSHSSGVVISSRPIAETVPVMWSATEIELEEGDSDTLPTNLRIIQWDKRSAKYFFDKFDILCLRGQDVLSGTQRRLRVGNPSFNVEQISLEDEETYRTMRSGELIGIPQSASPAMRQAHIRVRTSNLHDASLVQAGIRPGVGGAVKINELIARRRGKPFSFEHPDLESILGITYGIVVFQEQVDQLLQKFAGFSSGEAEETREAIHKRRREDYGQQLKDEIIARIKGNGYSESVAEHVFTLVAEFKGYGFAQGHALAFAEISIRSIYCQQNYPAEYFASLLSAQPAGYYGPATLVNEARARGVAILPPSVAHSEDEFSVESVQSSEDPKLIFPNGGIRIALSQISGISKSLRERILFERRQRAFLHYFDFVQRCQPERDELEVLILCGALDDLCPHRRAMLWGIPLAQQYSNLFAQSEQPSLDLEFRTPELDLQLDDFPLPEKALHERNILDLDVTRHLMAFERDRVKAKSGLTTLETRKLPGGVKCMVVGNPIRLRFPPTPSGKRVVFFDLEDETGLLNVTCFDAVYRRDGHAIVCSPYVTILGETQDRDGHTAFLAHKVFPYRPTLASSVDDPKALPLRTADFLVG